MCRPTSQVNLRKIMGLYPLVGAKLKEVPSLPASHTLVTVLLYTGQLALITMPFAFVYQPPGHSDNMLHTSASTFTTSPYP